ncbi:MAG: bifunctional 5,10-methylenetetrahydrofolate dehydrogenase/5,10-methenyltetrahydrofolate cyclohydrolase [Flavonifractor sp.]|nr:bifunctional 5,10-methylenetetrahydrofolate dehydrogenase/5,10-methenyltetrahydrofolate cyclohydrolase [Flavonifractor sp.]
MAELWKGAPAAAALMEDLTGRIERLSGAGVTPTLAIVRVGERPDDRAYETGAVKRCEKAGVAVKRFPLPAGCSALELRAVLEHINAVSEIHGCLMLRPLPDPAMEEMACALLDPKKDVDCMTPAALAGVFAGKGWGYPPCTAQACLELLKYYKTALTGKRAVVVGRSLVIGKPVSMLLQAENATVTMCHTRTVDLPAVCRGAEVLIAAAGRANLLGAAHVSPGQVVLDVGINVDESGKLCGDVKFDEAEPVVSAITPVPGGVGAVTTAVLVKHVVEAAERTLQ